MYYPCFTMRYVYITEIYSIGMFDIIASILKLAEDGFHKLIEGYWIRNWNFIFCINYVSNTRIRKQNYFYEWFFIYTANNDFITIHLLYNDIKIVVETHFTCFSTSFTSSFTYHSYIIHFFMKILVIVIIIFLIILMGVGFLFFSRYTPSSKYT